MKKRHPDFKKLPIVADLDLTHVPKLNGEITTTSGKKDQLKDIDKDTVSV